ncbi:MAG: phenylalanine--tRNA ligase subunit beta [Bacillota bacterium]|nr:phenylalanine--tRNA ligase subunit beta [Bacillota bacterium]
MLVPINWLKEYVDINTDVRDLSDKLTMTGTHVDSIINMDKNINNIYVGKITKLEPHPNADKLQVAHVNLGDRKLKLITGAKNISENDLVPVAVEGAVLPNGMEIGKTDFRGIESQGMLCSYEELGIDSSLVPKESKDGIIIINEDIELGKDIVDVLNLKGHILDLEITFNRPDCLSMVGIGRETAATLNTEFKYPDIQINNEVEDIKDYVKDIKILDKDLCRRYYTKVIKDVKIGPSPMWLQRKIMDAGIRPINNIVDATNYVMLEVGQPLHAFDLDSIEGKIVKVRRAKTGETIKTLDQTNRKLDEDMLIIADETKPIGIAGVMGGYDSEVRKNSKTILMESANFDGKSVRETSKKLGLRSEASSRNEKDLPNEIVVDACNRVCQIIESIGAGTIVKGFIDRGDKVSSLREVIMDPINCNNLLGTNIEDKKMVDILNSLNIESKLTQGKIVSKIPNFRKDLEIEADLIEEVGRIHGFHNIPPKPLKGNILKGSKSELRKVEDKSKDILYGLGLYEITTYSFISPKEYDRFLVEDNNPLRNYVEISNPLGEDFSSMRTTLLPNMLKVISKNSNYGIKEGMLFEIGNTFNNTNKNTPDEIRKISIGIYGGYDFFSLKGIVENLLTKFGLKYKFVIEEKLASFHPGRTARILIDDIEIGLIGEIHPDVRKNYEIDERTYVAEIDVPKILKNKSEEKIYHEIAKYPSVTRDISIVVDEDVLVGNIIEEVESMSIENLEKIEMFDIYRGKNIEVGKKSLAYTMVFRSSDKTLLEEEVNDKYEKILERLKTVFNAKLR